MGIKMHRVILILGVLLFPKALSALECYDSECYDLQGTGSCSSSFLSVDCPASQLCGTTATRTYTGGTYVYGYVKSCVPSARCDVRGSMDNGISRTLSSTKCCSTDLCNVQFPTIPSGSPSNIPNGKRCFTCKDNDCSNILSCSGDEDRCFMSYYYNYEEDEGKEEILNGCISKNLCESLETDNISYCCEGDLCNSSTNSAVSLLLLLAAPVVSVALFN